MTSQYLQAMCDVRNEVDFSGQHADAHDGRLLLLRGAARELVRQTRSAPLVHS